MNMHNNDVCNVKMLKIPNTFPYMRFDLIYLFYTFIHFDVFAFRRDALARWGGRRGRAVGGSADSDATSAHTGA